MQSYGMEFIMAGLNKMVWLSVIVSADTFHYAVNIYPVLYYKHTVTGICAPLSQLPVDVSDMVSGCAFWNDMYR